MIETQLFLYRLLGTSIVMIMPFGMLLGVLWILIKMAKGFFKSILK